MRRRRVRAIFLASFGLATGVWAALEVQPRAAVLLGWSSATATMQRVTVASSHDAQGYGVYRPSGSYAIGGATFTCSYGQWARDYGWAAEKADVLRTEASREAYFSGQACELAAADILSFLDWPFVLLLTGGALVLAAFLLWRAAKAAARCATCGSALQPRYRFCPECGESIPKNRHPIAI